MLTPAGRSFTYQGYQGDGSEAIFAAPQRLRRIAKPFGFDVAKASAD